MTTPTARTSTGACDSRDVELGDGQAAVVLTLTPAQLRQLHAQLTLTLLIDQDAAAAADANAGR